MVRADCGGEGGMMMDTCESCGGAGFYLGQDENGMHRIICWCDAGNQFDPGDDE